MKLVTVATHKSGYYPYLLKSSKKYGLELITLGRGMVYTSHHMKDELMLKYTKGLSNTDVVLFVDGFDSILGPRILELEEIFKKSKHKLVICSENIHNLVVQHRLCYMMDFTPISKNIYLNTSM